MRIEERTKELGILHEQVFGAALAVPRNGNTPHAAPAADEVAIIEKVCEKREFAALWRGQWQGDYPSQSEADLALCGRIAFYVGPDESLIDRVFRQSRLLREKWDDPRHGRAGSTYGADTIARALLGKTEFYAWHRNGFSGAAVKPRLHAPNGPNPTPIPLSAVVATFRKWLYLPDDGHIKVALGTYAANVMEGDPVWLMLVGAPGSGKTETLISLDNLAHIAARSALTGEAALLSGTARREKAANASGGLLREVGPFGVLVLKDFTTILSMKHDQRAPLLAALREVFDGSYTRSIGVDGGRTLAWDGKLGVIAGCTPIIDSHHTVIGAMGERFVFYRLPVADADTQARTALSHAGKVKAMRRELAEAVSALFAGLSAPYPETELTPDEEARLVDLSVLAVRCRSAVERDGRTRVIDLIPDPEAPGRLAGVLHRLFCGLATVGVERDEAWRLLARVCTDSMPALRWAAFREAARWQPGKPLTTTEYALATRHPAVTVRRALEDLHAHGIMVRTPAGKGRADEWELSEWARERFERLAKWLAPAAGAAGTGSCSETDLFRKNSIDTEVSPSSPSKNHHTVSGGFFGKGSSPGTTVGTEGDFHARMRACENTTSPEEPPESLSCSRCGAERPAGGLVLDETNETGFRCRDAEPCANRIAAARRQ